MKHAVISSSQIQQTGRMDAAYNIKYAEARERARIEWETTRRLTHPARKERRRWTPPAKLSMTTEEE